MSGFEARFGEPKVAAEGARLRVIAALRNESDRTWACAGPVHLAYQILDPETGALVIDGARTSLPADLEPGQEARIEVEVQFPPEDGAYRALVSLVEENVAWFHTQGADCLMVEAEVRDGRVLALRARRATPASRAAERVVQALAKALVYPFRALWRNRALIASMVRRDIQGRYRGSVAGLFWTVLHPLLLMATYFFVFAVVLKVRFGSGAEAAGPVNFLLYFIAGMLPWLAFSEALGRSANVVLEHRTLVTRVVFPVEILPVNLAAAGLVSEFFGLLVFVAAIAGVGKGTPPATALYLPLVLIPQILLTIGLCWFLAALGVFLRDTGQFLSFLLTLWFFATPICYPETLVPPALQGVFGLNPVYVLARAYRAIFLEAAAPSWSALGGLSAAALALFLFGFAWFHKAKKVFADVI